MDSNIIWGNFVSQSIVLTVTGIFATLTIILRKKLAIALVKISEKVLKLKIYKDSHINKYGVDRDIRIQDILSELRTQTKSDRCYLFQFHNGNSFTSKNQMWKLSCTHESVSIGIHPSLGDLQGIISSSVSDLIYPFWEKNIDKFVGIEKISPSFCSCFNKEKCSLPNGVFFYNIANLKEGFCKGLVSSHGVKYMILSPLIDDKDNTIGFLGLDFCWQDASIEEIKKNAELVCKTSSTISYELTKKIN